MNQAFQIRPNLNGYKRSRPVRSEKYRAFLRRHACCACDSTRMVEAAHTGPHGLSTKADDTKCIPLCLIHHRTGADSLHALGVVQFERTHGIRITTLIRKFNSLFEGAI